jgi:hypothetical protein
MRTLFLQVPSFDGFDGGAGSRYLAWREILSLRGLIVHKPSRPFLEDMDKVPFVSPVYRRNLDVRKNFIAYPKHLYPSFYTGRGCKSRCTFYLWPRRLRKGVEFISFLRQRRGRTT